jgi:hypothetical protein
MMSQVARLMARSTLHNRLAVPVNQGHGPVVSQLGIAVVDETATLRAPEGEAYCPSTMIIIAMAERE